MQRIQPETGLNYVLWGLVVVVIEMFRLAVCGQRVYVCARALVCVCVCCLGGAGVAGLTGTLFIFLAANARYGYFIKTV